MNSSAFYSQNKTTGSLPYWPRTHGVKRANGRGLEESDWGREHQREEIRGGERTNENYQRLYGVYGRFYMGEKSQARSHERSERSNAWNYCTVHVLVQGARQLDRKSVV